LRIDKYIWSIRICKTRSIANKYCNDGKVLLNNENTKASKSVKENDIISIKYNPIWRVFKIINLPKSRIGNKLVLEYVKEITPEEDLLKMNEYHLINKQNKNLGIKGRPTKKNRRNLNGWID
jgi:ribosome-associated heat shock protein Hsp15